MKLVIFFLFVLAGIQSELNATTILVGNSYPYKSVKDGLRVAEDGDTVIVFKGHYKEGNIAIKKSIIFLGSGMPILDGDNKYEVVSVFADNVIISGFRIQNSGHSSTNDLGAIKVYDSRNVVIKNNYLHNNFFAVYIQKGTGCRVLDNKIIAFGKEEQSIGNGIHCWKSDSLVISGNSISGHRDGIYFEFVTHSVIWRNISKNNIRYGLHFMFSHDDAYFTNYFKNNGAGVAVMFTRNVVMMNNTFEQNWGDAAYGLLFKEISDCYMMGNKFVKNTIGIFMDGTNRIKMEFNEVLSNGWGMKMQANCMDNVIENNNFRDNTFDISTNGSLILNTFNENYWDKYEGYDLNRDKTGDVSYHPLSLYAVITEQNPPVMLLYRSFIVNLLDKSEKIIPSLTPDNFVDHKPRMLPIKL